MMARLGIELGARTLRGVRLEGWYRTRARTVEIEWDGAHPAEAVAALRQHLGPARRIALALDLPLLFTKQVKLPALGPAGKRSILRLEPERFFAVRAEDIVPAVRGDDNLVFAAKEGPLAEWVAALEQLGPVDVIEPGPVALARALGRAGLTTAVTVLDAEGDGVGVVEMCDGRVVRARRVFGGLDAVAAALRHNGGTPATLYLRPWSEERVRALGALVPDATLRPLPAVGDVVGAFLPAYGAALASGTALDFAGTLVPPELATRITARRRRALALASAACAAALVFALTSLDASRARATSELGAGLEALRQRAAPALALQNELEALEREARAIHEIESERSDPLRVLLALSQQLPAGAYLRGLRLSGGDGQIDGYAPNASRLVAQLGGLPEFRDVHFLSATNRVAVGDRTYETFTLAFRYAAAP